MEKKSADRRIPTIAIALCLVLFLTNIGWALLLFDRAIGWGYQKDAADTYATALQQSLIVASLTRPPERSREAVIEAVSESWHGPAFERDGVWVVGNLELRFDEQDRLIEVRPVYENELVRWESP